MSRTIKFRIWNPYAKDMTNKYNALRADGVLMSAASNGVYFETDLEITKEVVMQFTGLLDSKGKEIYESDIVEMNPIGSTGVRTGIVIWMNDGWFISDETDRDLEKRLWEDSFGLLKVIGNVYENPNLLN